MQLSKEQIQRLNDQNLSFRFADQAVSYEEDETTGRVKKVRGSKPVVICDIFDKTTGQQFFSAKGDTEPQAFELAMVGAATAAKPLTPAQRSDPRYTRMEEVEKENAELRKRLNDIEMQSARRSKAPAPPATGN